MHNYSIILPSRSAPEACFKMIKSIYEKSSNIQNLEVVLIIDEDNYQQYINTINYLHYINDIIYKHNSPNLNSIKIFVGQRNPDLNNYCYNEPFQYTNGKYLFGPSDNLEIFLQNYDYWLFQITEDYLKDKPDRILYIMYNDHVHECNTNCCWPIITRETFNTLGSFVPKELPHSGADHALYFIFDKLKQLGYDRILNIPYFTFFHCHPDININNAFDAIEFRDKGIFREIIKKYRTSLTEEEILNYASLLKEYIDSKQ